ncbi:hypothetical protein N7471_007087 [Penicillium samsonianum]|uniref:uncharacterized protein n=1 Tax=Penicillium samsonianum TaxID=1882272 RepID=UPI0025468217|nr:uncharacterized protein N7471_007087 [Penicillium samsonianum]KAJ6131872.1 hypothetical protein N7471_007087 [Penicillium samsonianum]
MPNYEGPVPNSRSLYGWAPGSDDEDGAAREESEDDQMQPFLHSRFILTILGISYL